MTDRIAGFLVILDEDMRADDAEHVRDALNMIKGVHDVEFVGANLDQAIAASRVRSELAADLFDVIQGNRAHPERRRPRPERP